MINKDGGTTFGFYGGGHSCYEGGHIAHGGGPPTRENLAHILHGHVLPGYKYVERPNSLR